MCGICGVVFAAPQGPHAVPGHSDAAPGEPLVAAMVRALTHRGPDEVGIEAVPGAVLGATRLAIRGLASGRQPILDRETGVIVVCNGEIDNSAELRRWLEERGRSVPLATDVAVLHGLYLELGDRFVEEIAGAFAIGLYDPRDGTLLLARDRAGERPLFYCRTGGEVRFATEITALATDPALPLSIDPGGMAWYLRFGSFCAPGSPYREIRKVAPGEIVTFRQGKVSPRRYWRWPVGEVNATKATATKAIDPQENFDAIFREAVRRQSEAEVDYGVFLSGGIDSSLVAAVARAVRPERTPYAFTLRFEEPSFDEGDFAGRVAAELGYRPVDVWVRAEDLPEGIAALVRMVGEPLADPAWVPTALLARRAAEEVKLCLVGEGADELFGGYPTYLGARAAAAYARWPRWLRRGVRRLVEAWPPSDRKVTVSFLLKRFVAGEDLDGLARHFLWTSNLPPALLQRLGVVVPATPDLGGERLALDRLLDLVQHCDLEYFLGEGLLTKADRASMQSAVELRAPFLDRSVMEFAATLPARERVRGLTTKVFLKRYALRYLPKEIVHRRKRGLSVPLARWLRGPLRSWAEDRLTDPRLAGAGLHAGAIERLHEEHQLRRADHARALWTLIVLDEWLRWTEDRQ